MLDSKMIYGGTLNAWQKQMRDIRIPVSAHMEYAMVHIIHDEFSYDATDDGPEVELIRFFRYWPDGRGKGHSIFKKKKPAAS